MKIKIAGLIIIVLTIGGILITLYFNKKTSIQSYAFKPTVLVKDQQPNEIVVVNHHPLSSKPLISVGALKNLLSTDSQLADFYQREGFDVNCAVLTILPENELMYNSYRLKKDIHFTEKPELILAGTKVFRDCNGTLVKANCANILLSSNQIPVDPVAVSNVLSIPPPDVTLNPQDVFNASDTLVPPSITAINGVQSSCDSCGSITAPSFDSPIITPIVPPVVPPVAPTPEPNSFTLYLITFCLGICVILWSYGGKQHELREHA